LRVFLLVAAQAAHEVLGAALGDGAQVLDRLGLAHADAVVADGEGFGLGVKAHAHFQRRCVLKQRRVVERLKAQPVAGVGGVGDELAQEDVFVGIQRMRDQMQQLGHFGLECVMGAHGVRMGFW